MSYLNIAKGMIAEATALDWLNGQFKGWEFRKTPKELDLQGIDILGRKDDQVLKVQVKSSLKGVEEFKSDYRYDGSIKVLLVNGPSARFV